jgi:hypothetical protein
MAKQTLVIKITTPDEGYGDIHPELILADFMGSPHAFEVEIMEHSELDCGDDCAWTRGGQCTCGKQKKRIQSEKACPEPSHKSCGNALCETHYPAPKQFRKENVR